MNKKILGKDLEVSSIGLGCMGMSHAYGTASTEKEAKELIEKAIDLGCTFFDMAEIYGTAEDPHHNEKLLGEVLKPYRNKIVLASKCGIRFDESATTVNKPLIPDGRPETIKAFAKDKNATPAQISLAWMSAKKPYIVPIPGTRKLDRLEENMRASEVHLTDGEVRKIDEMLDQIPMSQVFGGSKIKN